MKSHPKRDPCESLQPKVHPKGPEATCLTRLKPTTQPHKYPTEPTRIHLHRLRIYPLTPEGSRAQWDSHQLKRRWLSLMPPFQTKTYTNRLKPWKTPSKIPRKKSKSLLKMSWRASAKKMNIFASYEESPYHTAAD
jgi:hypothetical protein